MYSLQTLQDIAAHVQINFSDFFVCNINYKSEKLPAELIKQLQQLPEEIQENYINASLNSILRRIYYEGSLTQETIIKVNQDYIDLEKSAVKIFEIDWEFYAQLNQNNRGKGSFYQNFRVVRQEADGSLAVEHENVTIHIQREYHLQLAHQLAAVGDLVAVRIPPHQFKRGFYTVIGDALVDFNFSIYPLVVYFNFSAEGAVAVMKTLTAQLNDIKLPFTFMTLYNPSNYGRYDAGMLRFAPEDYELVRPVLQNVYAENQLHFHNQIPIFTKMLAPGLALAESPKQQIRSVEDFGMNRCQIIANALMEAHKKGDESPEARMKYILKQFEQYGIDLERPYLNPGSEDIYTPLDVTNGVTVN
ncbi:MAG: hypothetical protein F6K37_32270 [Moorea sp. SIO4E2]|uniref:T3SS effector HopA1 family protein n=1 Tax=Moorena sp. SIO4E2 TaxID=2607826 RepID=UPI0013BA2A4C|nr:T3SS effector HopA1 family protein [Moorena sp. SIO4E2]NEQ10437.1 hypothetical protein [Moorena sp. SIO4E2]